MKATFFGLLALSVIGACAEQAEAPATTCNPKSVGCDVAGATGSAGAGGGSAAGASGTSNGGSTPTAGSDQGGAASGAPAAGGPAGGAPAGGASTGGAPAGGGPAGGAPAGGAPAGGAPAGGAPAGGAPAGGSGGAGATNLVVIRANRDKNGTRNYLKVVAPGNSVQWAALTEADAEKFEVVAAGTNQVKLRATSVDKYVVLDQAVVAPATAQNDYLVATGTAANAAIINNALCAFTNANAAACAPNCRGLQVMGDDDVNNFVVSDDQFTFATGARARSNSCGNTAGAWESWEFIAK